MLNYFRLPQYTGLQPFLLFKKVGHACIPSFKYILRNMRVNRRKTLEETDEIHIFKIEGWTIPTGPFFLNFMEIFLSRLFHIVILKLILQIYHVLIFFLLFLLFFCFLIKQNFHIDFRNWRRKLHCCSDLAQIWI